ncbi:DNA repair metallo-beta-lactamase [Niveomyces insectorum RCEF 264]|uniref:DNA repair metallo-beta-lactamase n=1 Tax=Niveomyces insectorum RCEF 264 TaxID=1081102 RepID=A0A167ZCQ2_9HYPO|nr:DNA repair metallo-beta-lactamase [Niveomyces insectorum RCEF 264]
MSTFDGHIREFPDIQVDYFRRTPETASRWPLACFLSHVHSDHLVGLESLRSPFVYCSAATRALVLRLERYPCRLNFNKGILEATKRTYKHLKHLLKPLPLETPTVIELSPGNNIRVTLFDANHCPGSVMFLFENEKRAALYTGDTRCEPWFVNALIRSPCLAEYAAGLRVLDTVYLDTTHIEEDTVFQTKTEGISELLQKVSRYPPDTVFYFRSWTFGYEDVWIVLANHLRSKVHIDPYKMGLYASLTVKAAPGQRFVPQFALTAEAPRLVGFLCANAAHEGCLVSDDGHDDGDGDGCGGGDSGNARVRIHSCDRGAARCAAVRNAPALVELRPVVCHRSDGRGDLAEVGAGGGGDDLHREAELEVAGGEDLDRFWAAIDKHKGLSPETKAELRSMMGASLPHQRFLSIPVDVDAVAGSADTDDKETTTKRIADAVRDMAAAMRSRETANGADSGSSTGLPRTVTFPYSRHASYAELCDLLDKLRPRDVWPCTVNPAKWFHSGKVITIEDLFGRYCSGDVFRHDIEVAAHFQPKEHRLVVEDSQATTESYLSSCRFPPKAIDDVEGKLVVSLPPLPGTLDGPSKTKASGTTRPVFPFFYNHMDCVQNRDDVDDSSQATTLSDYAHEQRWQAHRAVLQNALGMGEWMNISLASTTDNHTEAEADLGCW